MENFFSHLKEEALRQHPIPSLAEAKHIIDDYIHFYNFERIRLKTKQTPYVTRCLSSEPLEGFLFSCLLSSGQFKEGGFLIERLLTLQTYLM
jgi:hypothetical protein